MDTTPTLHFFCGKAGAGKTAVATGLAMDHSSILLSEDIWLLELYGEQMTTFDDYIRVSKRLKAVVGPLTVDLLRSGQSVVMDFQANTRSGRSWFRSLFEQASANHVLHFVDTPDAVCLERIARRNIERPPGSHRLTEEDFVHISSFFQPPEDAEGFNVKQYTS
jgi:predicted kinase